MASNLEKNDVEVEVKSPADKFWNSIRDSTNLFPKAFPDQYKSIEVVEGDGKSVGSVRLIKYAEDISGETYMSWALDAEKHLAAMGLSDTIKNDKQNSDQDKAKAMIFLRHHLDDGLKMEYLTIKDPLILWNNLKERYDHLKMVVLPQARYEWTHLRLQDFKNITDYNSDMFKIKSQFNLCGENITDHDMLEKTFSTFPASSMVLQQQYREMGFKKYSELISHLLVAEQHNGILIKNNESRPPGTTPFSEVNAVNFHQTKYEKSPGPSRGRGRGRGRYFNQNDNFAQKNNTQQKGKDEAGNATPRKKYENKCYRCGGKGHWSRTCRTPRHLVNLYQASLKKPDNVETNFVVENKIEPMNLDVADFFIVSEDQVAVPEEHVNRPVENEYAMF